MDEIVAAAMRKWPNVPDVYGWLSLDRRGNWLLRDEPIGNVALREFINRNYTHDANGRWYFQNGPQRVFVRLAATPLIYRLHRDAGALVATAHTGAVAQEVSACRLIDDGSVLLESELGPGLVQDRDLALAFEGMRDVDGQAANERTLEAVREGNAQRLAIEFASGTCILTPLAQRDLAQALQFVTDPAPEPTAGQ